MPGPPKNLPAAWELLRIDSPTTTKLLIENPEGPGRYLGCRHILEKECTFTWQGNSITQLVDIDGKPVATETPIQSAKPYKARAMIYDMESFFASCVDLYPARLG